MKKVIICPGPHKTGTTSFQKFINIRKKNLADKNVYLLPGGSNDTKFFFAFCPDIKAHHMYTRYENARKGPQFWKQYILNFSKTFDHGHLLVSAEDLSLLRREELNDMRAFLLDVCEFDEVIVAITLRNPFDYVNSFIIQSIKAGFTTYSEVVKNQYPSFLKQRVLSPNVSASDLIQHIYFAFIDNCLDIFSSKGGICWLDYRLAKKQGIETLFFERISHFDSHFPSLSFNKGLGKKLNPSISKEGIAALLLLNEYEHTATLRSIRTSRSMFKNLKGRSARVASFSEEEFRAINETWNKYMSIAGFSEEEFTYSDYMPFECFKMKQLNV